MEKRKCMSSLLPGESGVVSSLICTGRIRRRFQDIGLIRDTSVTCIGKSPPGDPCAYLIRGKVIAIRREDAEKVLLI